MKQLLHKLPPYTFTVIIVAVIAYLTLVPHPLPDNDMELFPGADKVVHAIMFGALTGAIALDRAFKNGIKALGAKSLVIYAIIGSLAGGVIELLQGWMGAGRSADVWDFVADTLGAILAASIARPVIKRWFL